MLTLGGGYRRHAEGIFFSTQRVAGADSETFEYLGGSWGRDRARVYSAGTPIKANVSSFVALSYIFGKDSTHVYYLGGRVPEADAPAFEALDSGYHFAAPGAHPVAYAGYGRDAEAVFHYTFTVGKPCIVRGALPSSFRSLHGTFGIDQEGVFVDKRRIKGADPRSWCRLQGLYSQDAARVFYDDRVVEGAMPGTFICLWGRHGTWGKDGSRYFDIGKESTGDAYFKALEAEIAALRVAGDRLRSGAL